jgi:phosphoglycerate kinase
VLPIDVVVVSKENISAPDARMQARTVSVDQVGKDDVILDLGPGTGTLFADHALRAKTFLWNGPLGNYENGFVDSTNALTKGAAESKGHTIIGGGDTIAAIENLGVLHKFSFVSTGGGAMLDLIANGTLPGIAVLDRQV